MPRFLVVLHNGSSSDLRNLGIFTAEDGPGANGLAAIYSKTSGKFTAFPLDESTTTHTEVNTSATSNAAPFDD